MITKWYQVKCKICLFSESFFAHNSKEAIKQARDNGWIIKRKNHYCSQKCREAIFYQPKELKELAI